MSTATLREPIKSVRRKRAARAVKRFNQMVPALRDYARKETGNTKLKIKAGSNSYTDGNLIVIKPPIELGDEHQHNGLCNQRAFGLSMCPECSSREQLMAVLRHEIGHIVQGSFGQWNFNTVVRAARTLDVPDNMIRKLESSAVSKPDEPLILHVNTAGHPWLSFASLVHEDIRCDSARLKGDAHEEEIFTAVSEEMLVNGIDTEDGGKIYYVDMEADQQLCLTYLFMARGGDPEGYVDPDVYAHADTPEMRAIGQRAVGALDVTEGFQVAVEFFNHARTLGYFDTDGMNEDELHELFEALNELLKVIVGHGMGIDGDGQLGGGSGGRGSTEDSEVTAEIDNAVRSLQNLDRVPLHVAAPIVRCEEGPAYKARVWEDGPHRDILKSNEKDLSPALTAARIAFGVNARTEHTRNQRSGRVDGRMLARRVPFGDDRLFGKKVRPDKRNYRVVIGMDASGSTSGGVLRKEKQAVMAMADVCDRLGITFEIWAHTTEMTEAEFTDAPVLYKIKEDTEAWSKTTKGRLEKLRSSGANLDGHTLQFYRKRVERGRETDKILMYYTDGAMPASNYDEELEVLRSEIAHCKKNGITLMAVGMGTNSPRSHGFDTAVVEDSNDYRKVVEHLGKRLR